MKTFRIPMMTVGVLLAASAVLAQTPSKKAAPPPAAPPREVRFPPFEQKTLTNGLRVVVIEQHEQPLVSLRLQLKAGRTFEPAAKAGLAGATASLLTKGTATRSAQQIAEAIDFVGGSLNASTGVESGFASASVTSDQLDLGFDLLSDVILHPTFPQDELERWRRQALSNLQIEMQDAGSLARNALPRLLFGAHPYGNPADGTPESLRGLTRDDLMAFHKRRYVPNDAILAVVGDIRPADAFARAEKAFGAWAKGETAQVPPVPAPALGKGHKIVVIDKPDAVQTEIYLGQVGIPFRDPDLYVERVYNTVLGGTPSARLFDEVRRKRGLAYGAGSFFLEPTQPGWFVANTSTKTESTLEALEVTLDVIRGLGKEPAPASELGLAKTFITGSFPLEIETPDGIASKVLEALKFGYGREFLEGYNDQISRISAADVERFAKERIHSDDMAIVLVGKASAFSGELKKKFGAFETIPATEVDFLQADLRKPKAEKPAVSAADQTQGLELIKKVQAALGGKAFLEQKTQIAKGSGSMSPPGMPQPLPIPSIVNYRVLPDKERTEIQLPMGTMVQVFNGTEGWASLGGQTQDATAQGKEDQQYGFDLLRRAGQAGYTVRPLPGGAVEIADAQGHATQFFVDPRTSLVTKVSYESGGQKTEAVYTDYREVSGIKIPFQTNVSQNGQPFLEIKYSDVQVNVPVDEGLFKKPGS